MNSISEPRDISVESTWVAHSPAIFLHFEKGRRPSRADVLAALSGSARLFVSHDPCESDGSPQDRHSIRGGAGEDVAWLELLCDGLTFDLLGLDGGPPLSTGTILHRFGCAETPEGRSSEAIGLFPGPHLAEGANSIPVVRTLLGVALEIIDSFPGCRIAQWSPTQAAISVEFFRKTVGDWLKGGPFPALGLVAYRVAESGRLQSVGFAFLSDYEISIAPELSADRVAATQLAIRVVHSLVGSQPPDTDLPFEFEGRSLVLHPDGAKRLIFIEPA